MEFRIRKEVNQKAIQFEQLNYYVDAEGELHILGSVEVLDKKAYNDKIVVCANLCKKDGALLKTISDYKSYAIDKTTYFTFSLWVYDANVKIVGLEELSYIEFYIMNE